MEQQMEFNFESSIRGYHVYKSIWTYEIGEKLRCDREENNPNDKFAVQWVLIKFLVFQHQQLVPKMCTYTVIIILC
jgi:hypothetical protein